MKLKKKKFRKKKKFGKKMKFWEKKWEKNIKFSEKNKFWQNNKIWTKKWNIDIKKKEISAPINGPPKVVPQKLDDRRSALKNGRVFSQQFLTISQKIAKRNYLVVGTVQSKAIEKYESIYGLEK